MKHRLCAIQPVSMLHCCLFSLLLAVTSALWGQDPFGGSAPPDDTALETAEGKEDTSQLDELVAAETDPVVRAVLESKPEAPEQWLSDARDLLNLNRPALAKEYLKQFLAAMPEEERLAEIQSNLGTALFLRFRNTTALQPEGTAVADAVMQAAGAQIADTARIDALIERLSDPDATVRRRALVELAKVGPLAAAGLLHRLADESRQADHAVIRSALLALGDAAEEPLIAALESSNPSLRLQVIGLLEEFQAMQAVPRVLADALAAEDESLREAARKMLRSVLGNVPSQAEAIRYLSRRLREHLEGTAPGPIDESNQVIMWVWDSAEQMPRQQSFSAEDATFLSAAQVAKRLHRIAPDDEQFERMHLATGLEVAKRTEGYDRMLTADAGTIYEQASSADHQLLLEVLQLALKHEMEGAAVAVTDLLGDSQDIELLQSDSGQPTLLVQALVNPLPRVKFAAARAVMNLDPTEPYAGSSYLVDVLGFLAAGGGQRRVLIGHPRLEPAQTIAGHLNVLGFAVDVEQTGRQTVLQAVSSPDYAFALLHDAIDRPAYRELVQQLRHHNRTGRLPIGVIARDMTREGVEWFARTDPLTLALAPPQNLKDVALDAQRLLALAGRSQILPDERTRHAHFALDALAQLAGDREKYGFYELLPLDESMRELLTIPALASKAAKLLGLLGTPRAQRALVNFASAPTLPLADRQAAAAAFEEAVSRRGLLLTREQLLRQYEIYNASEFLDEGTQQVLASILDTIEAPSRASAAVKNDS